MGSKVVGGGKALLDTSASRALFAPEGLCVRQLVALELGADEEAGVAAVAFESASGVGFV